MNNSSRETVAAIEGGNTSQFGSVNVLRVLLIILVVFIHENPTFEGQGYVGVFIHTIAQSAVPLFFVLAGFFFFYKKQIMTADFYRGQLKKRFFSLFIPYMLWNCLPILLVTGGNLFSIIFRGKTTDALLEYYTELWNDGLWHIFWDKVDGKMPYDSPLWFLRDLIVVCLLTPVFYYAIKLLGRYFVPLLLVMYLIVTPPHLRRIRAYFDYVFRSRGILCNT